MHKGRDIRHHANDDIGHNVGADQIIGLGCIGLAQQIRDLAGNVGKPAILDVLVCHAYCHGIDIVSAAFGGTET